MTTPDPIALLSWHLECGVDEALSAQPVSRLKRKEQDAPPAVEEPFAPPRGEARESPPTAPAAAAPMPPPIAQGPSPRALADESRTLADLEAAVRGYDGCSLKRFATRTVFADGQPHAELMVIGEAPGAQEDQEGIPFCGASGQLLDKMLNAAGRSRKGETPQNSYYITNMIFWRPPGNRTPTPQEVGQCLPFVEKHIALIRPKALLLAGATPTRGLLATETAISRLRGKRFEYRNAYLEENIPCFVTYHPSYLLRQPSQKALAWADMLTVQSHLRGEG